MYDYILKLAEKYENYTAPTIVQNTKPINVQGIEYRMLQWSNGNVDVFAQIEKRVAALRFRSSTDLAVLSQMGDPDLVAHIWAFSKKYLPKSE